MDARSAAPLAVEMAAWRAAETEEMMVGSRAGDWGGWMVVCSVACWAGMLGEKWVGCLAVGWQGVVKRGGEKGWGRRGGGEGVGVRWREDS